MSPTYSIILAIAGERRKAIMDKYMTACDKRGQ